MKPVETRLIPRTRAEVQANLDSLPAEVRAQFSPDWLALFARSGPQDLWVHGFRIVDGGGAEVGVAMFKHPPRDGMVEIAYAVNPDQQRKGHATAAARALAEAAFESKEVRVVRAHTLPDGIASQKALTRSGFTKVGEVVEPEDGLVWRFELEKTA